MRVSLGETMAANADDDSMKTQPSLLSKVRRGDEDGWRQFYTLYENFVYSAARGAGLSHEESRDVVQEVMLTVQGYIGSFVPDKSRGRFRTWLRKIVQSRIADQYRRKKRNPLDKLEAHRPSDDTVTSATNLIPDLNEVELDRLIDGKLEQAILAEAQRLVRERARIEDYQAYELFQIQELSAREAATSLRISPITVRVRAFRVRRAVEREARRLVKLLEHPKPPNP